MKEKLKTIFREVLKNVNPPEDDLKKIRKLVHDFKKNLKAEIKKSGIKAEVFEGGSFAKKTLIKKDIYDVDIFIRFDKKYKNEKISSITEKLLKKVKNVSKIHGSRDYFKIKKDRGFIIELVPVKKISKPQEAENVTDLSYNHVGYVNKKIKSKRILDDIKIAKSFCHFTKTYGAESYINGFSGYAIELLIYHYKGFLKFIKAIANHNPKSGKIIIDTEKNYKKKENILLDINSSKLKSPIILIDPTCKQRNALAALSEDTFKRFRKECQKFIKNPSIEYFKQKGVDIASMKKEAAKKNYEILIVEAKTKKQEGDIAGAKFLKFYNHLSEEIERCFDIKKRDFVYSNGKSAIYIFLVTKKKELILTGPFLNDEKNKKRFKSRHKKTFEKNGRVYAREKIKLGISEFIMKWKSRNFNRIKDMGIIELKESGKNH